jgi:hypothetical protein
VIRSELSESANPASARTNQNSYFQWHRATTIATGHGPCPYSLQEVYTIVATGVGAVNHSIDAIASVMPEPASLALMSTGLGRLVCFVGSAELAGDEESAFLSLWWPLEMA